LKGYFGQCFTIIIATGVLTACQSRHQVSIQLTIDSQQPVLGAVAFIGAQRDSLSPKQTQGKSVLQFQLKHQGEGTCQVCLYLAEKVICSRAAYVEGGYHLRMRWTGEKFETHQHF
jgi:hypothetical protein